MIVPAPVWMPQPSGPSISSGMPGGTLTCVSLGNQTISGKRRLAEDLSFHSATVKGAGAVEAGKAETSFYEPVARPKVSASAFWTHAA